MASRYDYIIAGAGCAGLSLLMRMIAHPFFEKKKILLIDKCQKDKDDRTWCFWENKPGFFEDILHHKWPRLWVKHTTGEIDLQLNGYQYKMIRGLDFYRYCFKTIEKDPRVDIVYGDIKYIDEANGCVQVGEANFESDLIFSSLPKPLPPPEKNEFFLLQHFRGWWIETDSDLFDPIEADLMNFRVSQKHGCTFVYVMPVSPRKALIEYTLFSANTLERGEYDEGLQDFISNELKIAEFSVSETEQGIIPMTNQKFPVSHGKVIFLGTAGGLTKASTGYTFQSIQKHSTQIIQAITLNDSSMLKARKHPKFNFYDGVLLRVLHEQKISGADVFYRLFNLNPAYRILRFLDDETHFGEDLMIMNSAPKGPFVQAAFKQMF